MRVAWLPVPCARLLSRLCVLPGRFPVWRSVQRWCPALLLRRQPAVSWQPGIKNTGVTAQTLGSLKDGSWNLDTRTHLCATRSGESRPEPEGAHLRSRVDPVWLPETLA